MAGEILHDPWCDISEGAAALVRSGFAGVCHIGESSG
jgi:hypothetical protein